MVASLAARIVVTLWLAFQTPTAASSASFRVLVGLRGGEENERLLGSSANASFKLADDFGGVPGFYHGVASGDPLADAVVLWTRFTPVADDEVVNVELRLAPLPPNATESEMAELLTANNTELISGVFQTSSASDWVIKVDVGNLTAGTKYVYGFAAGNFVSPVGTTQTAPDGHVEQMRYALFSCAHWTYGFFHAYDVASTVEDLDFWVHVGDYIYEHSPTSSSNGNARSGVEPAWETVRLQDYRLRYALYHTDEGLQHLRRKAPVIAVWDDHEFANNAWAMGAASHDENTEGSWEDRVRAATQAYFEWMPIRRGVTVGGILDDVSITQVIEWGDLATIVGLDTRIAVRSEIPTTDGNGGDAKLRFFTSGLAALAYAYPNVSSWEEEPLRSQFQAAADAIIAGRWNESFEMLGGASREIMHEAFNSSMHAGKPWQIFAGATMMGPLRAPSLESLPALVPSTREFVDALYASEIPFTVSGQTIPLGAYVRILQASASFNVPWGTDGWDGFLYEKNILLNMFNESTNNPVVLGGDLHDGFAWTLYHENPGQESTAAAVNLGCPSVSSPGTGEDFELLFAALGDSKWALAEHSIVSANPGLHFTGIKDKGFVAMTVTHGTHISEFWFINEDNAANTASNAFANVNYEVARNLFGSLTAPSYCGASYITAAGQRGSLTPAEACITTFDSERPLTWSAVLNPPGTTTTTTTTEADENATETENTTTTDENASTTTTEDTGSDASGASSLHLSGGGLLLLLGGMLMRF